MSSVAESNVKEKSLDESLINLVRMNPLLFEKGKRMKPYESMKERFEVWKSIATSLNLEPNFCIARWKHLRDRYRREIAKKKSHDKQSEQTPALEDWPLMEKMRFLDKYASQHHHYSHKLAERSAQVSSATTQPTSPSTIAVQQIFDGTNYDEPLQEAMDEQPLLTNDTAKRNLSQTTFAQSESIESTISPVSVRIEALLGGLGALNRSIAEKRILSYLCKCQLKALEGESIEDIQF